MEAAELLKLQFPSLEKAFFWLSTVKDIHLLRKEFYAEGVGQPKEQAGINTQRWIENNSTEISQLQDNNSVDFQLYQCAKSLHLVDTMPWPKAPVKHVVLICSLEQFIVERIKFIAESDIESVEYLYVLTGPRGLFNFEHALSAILAEWFGRPNEAAKINEIFDKFSDSCSTLQWTRDLSGLKKAIMKVMGVTTWPNNRNSYYYQDKEIYDSAARESGRQLLDCEGGPWPVTLDLVQYYLNLYLSPKLASPKMKVIPVVARGKDGRLARNDDTVEAWYHQYGKQILINNEKPLFIACNSMHTIPFVIQNLLYTTYYQDAMTRQVIRVKINNFIANTTQGITASFSNVANQILIAGPAAREFNVAWVLDSLAKLSFAMRTNIKNLIEEKSIDDEKELAQASHLKKMILYNRINPIKLVNSTIDLADWYYLNHDFVKISGLFNFAINVLKKLNFEDTSLIQNELKECTLLHILAFIRSAQHKLRKTQDKNGDLKSLRDIDRANLCNLRHIREIILTEFKQVEVNDSKEIEELYENCFQAMKHYFISLIEASFHLLGKYDKQLAFIYFGSHSRKQATPYSDVEFGILSETDDITYPKELTKLILLMIINLGETVLASLGISAYDRHGNKVSINGLLYDRYTRDGYSFDQNIEQACKTPLGKKIDGKVIYRLIGTPTTLSALFNPATGYKLDPYLPQIGILSELIYGDTTLYLQYQKLLSELTTSPCYGLSLLERDITKYLPNLKESLNAFTHKKYFYRPLSVLLDNIYSCYNPATNCDSLQKINHLYAHKAIDRFQKEALQQILFLTMYLRFKLHYKYNEQKVDLISGEPEFEQVNEMRNILRQLFRYFDNKLREYHSSLLIKEARLASSVLSRYRLFWHKNILSNDKIPAIDCRENIDVKSQLTYSTT